MSWEALYRGVSGMLEPFAGYILNKRVKAEKEDATRILERKGRASLARPDGTLVWMHGASVGETSMLLPLIDRLLSDDAELNILVTSGTVTSAEIMAKRLPERAVHQFVPMDGPTFVAKFLNHWKPDLAIWAESEIWPNLVLQTKESGAKMALINARMSQNSIDRWRAKRGFARRVFGTFDLILPADRLTFNALNQFSDSVIQEIGNLKAAAPALAYDKEEATQLKTTIGDRPVWLAASTHEEEKLEILSTLEILRKKHPDTLCIWQPRHPERGDNIALAASAHGKIARRSQGEIPDGSTAVYIMDTLGETGLALALSDIVFMGGSLDPRLMGHNPLEPARAGVPILTGPHVASFTDIYDRFFDSNAAMRVKSSNHLAKHLIALLGDGAARGQMSARAKSVAQESDGILDFTATKLQALL